MRERERATKKENARFQKKKGKQIIKNSPVKIADDSCPLSLALSSSPPGWSPLAFCAPVPPALGGGAAASAVCPSTTPFKYSARSRYSLNFAVMASFAFGFFSYLRCVEKYSRATLYSSRALE